MADDIEISADVSQAVSALGSVVSQFQKLAGAAGASDKVVNSAMRNMERGLGSVVADIGRTTSAYQRQAGSVRALTTAEQKLAAQRRATANTGVRLNSNGQAIDAGTGRFTGEDGRRAYVSELAMSQRLVATETDRARLAANRAESEALSEHRMKTQARLNETFATPARSAGSAEVARFEREATAIQRVTARQEDLTRMRERGNRQQQLATAFSKSFYGVADKNAGVLRRAANIMGQIPPATWGTKMGAAGRAIGNMSNSTRYAMYDVAASAAIAGTAILSFGVFAIRAATSHERAFANVRRTTQTTTAGYATLQRELELMSSSLPVTFEELSAIATAAGQLGIQASGITAFTATVAKLSSTTNLTSDAAATALARFRAFFAEVGNGTDSGLAVTEATFSNLASSILKVGVNSIATETGIVNVAVQIASMGSYAGFTANQVIGLAGALSSIGVAPELSRGSITRTFSLIGNAVSRGGSDLQAFAKLAGTSSQKFKEAWGTERFAGVFTDMMMGLYNVTKSGEDANLMLMEMGFNSIRDRPLLLRLATAANEAGEAGGLLGQTMADAYQGWVENSELAKQYNIVSQTTTARLQVLGQAFEQLFATMGKQSGSGLGELASFLTDFVNALEGAAHSDVGQIFSTIMTQGALAAGAMLLVVAAGARTVASLQGIGVAYRAMNRAGVSSLRGLSMAFKVANLSLGLLGIIGTVAAVVGGFISMGAESRKAARGVQDVSGLVTAMATDYENGADAIFSYSTVTSAAAKEQRAAAEQSRQMTKALYGSVPGAKAAADGLGEVKVAAESVGYAYGEATKMFYRSQLQNSDGFQDLFNPDANLSTGLFAGLGSKMSEVFAAGLDPTAIDWDKYMKKSIDGTLNANSITKDLTKKLNLEMIDPVSGGLSADYILVRGYADRILGLMGDLSPEIKAQIGAMNAFGETSRENLAKVAAGGEDAGAAMSELSEEMQKALNTMGEGFAKFADTSSLIDLTQKRSTMSADEFKKAWSDAYGGSSFKLEEYLKTFRGAAKEQESFTEGLQTLAGRGLDWAIIQDLSDMGPKAAELVKALVNGTDKELQEFQNLWDTTGRDSMIALAARMQEGQYIVQNIMANGGIDALREFNKKVASGEGVNAALASMQRDIDGKPLTLKVNPLAPKNLSPAVLRTWTAQNQINLRGNVHLRVASGGAIAGLGGASGGLIGGLSRGYDSGGWTGPGSKMTPKGVVHADEFVMTKKATNSIGVANLYRMMRQAESGTRAPRGRGYAGGGLVGGRQGSSMPSVIHLSPEDRALLRGLQPILRIGNRDIAQAQHDANAFKKRQGVG